MSEKNNDIMSAESSAEQGDKGEIQKEVDAMKSKSKAKSKRLVVGGGLVVLIVLLLGLGVGGYWLEYSYSEEHPAQRWMAKTLPLPLVVVNGATITIDQYLYNLDSSTQFLSSPAFSELGLEGVLTQDDLVELEYDRLVNLAILDQYAEKQGVTVTQEDVDKYFNETILPQAEGGIEEMATVFEESYGWTVDEFKENIAREVVVREKLSEALAADEAATEEARRRAQEIYDEVTNVDGDLSFGEYAAKYSEDPGSASQAGSLGSFGKGVMVPEFEEAVFSMEIGDISEPIQTAFGFHIIYLTDKDVEAETVEASHILIRTKSLDDLLEEERSAAEIKDYRPAWLFSS